MHEPTVYTIHGQAIDRETSQVLTGPDCESVTLDTNAALIATAAGRPVEIHSAD